MRVWLITDTHFFHYKLVELNGRPTDFTERIIKNWHTLVEPEDLVFHLGDVAMGKEAKKERVSSVLFALPGHKVLILGNHDHESPTWYMTHGFDFACQSIVFRNVLLTHAPANELPANAQVNVHGHLHNNGHRDLDGPKHPWHKLLAVEDTHYQPVLWDKFVGPTPMIQL